MRRHRYSVLSRQRDEVDPPGGHWILKQDLPAADPGHDLVAEGPLDAQAFDMHPRQDSNLRPAVDWRKPRLSGVASLGNQEPPDDISYSLDEARRLLAGSRTLETR